MKNFKQTLFAVLIFFLSLTAQAQDQALLSAFDALGVFEKPLQVFVKVEEDTFFPYRPDIEGARVGFFKDQDLLGISESNSDGMAYLELETRGWDQGKTQIEVRLLGPRGFKAENQFLDIYLWPKKQKIVVTDIDQTLSQATKWQVLNYPVATQRAFPYASDVLKKFKSKGHKVFYLTAREDSLMEKTRRWLSHHDFPQGPLKVWDLDFWGGVPWDHGQYKYEVINDLRAQFPNVIAGFGDRPHDIEAYLMNDLPAYLLRSASNAADTFPAASIEYASWKEIDDLLSTGRF